jgi:hypothetical protein
VLTATIPVGDTTGCGPWRAIGSVIRGVVTWTFDQSLLADIGHFGNVLTGARARDVDRDGDGGRKRTAGEGTVKMDGGGRWKVPGVGGYFRT